MFYDPLGLELKHLAISIQNNDLLFQSSLITRATFETFNNRKKQNNENLFILVISLVEKIGRTVKQSSDLKTSSIPLQCLEAQLSSLSPVTVLLIMFVCHVHSGSHHYSWFSRISSNVANRYRKSTSSLKRSVSITSISQAIKLVNIECAVHPCRVGDIRWPGQKSRAAGHKRQHVINRRLRVLPTCPEWLRLSHMVSHTAATMLRHSRHRGESATKTVKFFVAHTVNYVICNNHTRIDWVLLYFTPVIQQNYHQPGWKFDKSFCAVDRLSYQLELSKSKTSQVRSDLVFDIVNYVDLFFFHGG